MSDRPALWYAEARRACRGALYLLAVQTPAAATRLSLGFAWLGRAINATLDARRGAHLDRLGALFAGVGPPPAGVEASHRASWALALALAAIASDEGEARGDQEAAERLLRWVAEDLLDATHPRWPRATRIRGDARALVGGPALLGSPAARLLIWLRLFDPVALARRLPTAGVTLAIGIGVTSSDSARQIVDLLAEERAAALATLAVGCAALIALWGLHRLTARRRGSIHPLMIGWEPFLWMKGQARPERGEARLIAPGEELTLALGAALGAQAAILAVVWAATLAAMGLWLGEGARTAASLTALFGAAVQLSFFLDYAVYHLGWPLRRLLLLATGALVVADDALGGELFVSAIFGVLALSGLGVAWSMAWRARRLAPQRPWWKVSGGVALALSAALLPAVWRNATLRGAAPWPGDGPAWAHVRSSSPGDRPSPAGADCAWPREEEGPVALFALAGGGSRSAIFAGLALERVEALDARLSLEGLPRILERTDAISSVSGGSLTNAALLQRLRAGHSLEGLADALGGDFLYPVLEGFLVPGADRAARLMDRWQIPALLGEPAPLSELAACWCGRCPAGVAGGARFPLPLFNATTVDGYRVVLSPLESDAYAMRALTRHARRVDAYAADDDPMWVYYRDGVYGLDEHTTYDPTLAQSVLASANFPFGFPLLRYASDGASWHFHAPGARAGADEGYLTDGGVLVNSGLWALYSLVLNQADALAERGVLLVIVDSSRTFPAAAPSKHAGLAMTIAVKNNALQRLHRVTLAHMAEILGDRLQVVIAATSPEREHSVITSWYLPERQRRRLDASFEAIRPDFERDLLDAWRALNGRGERPPIDWMAHPRPPMF